MKTERHQADTDMDTDPRSAEAVIDRLAAYAVTKDTFEESVLQADAETVVIVLFWAPWCEPCRTVAPVVLAAAAAREGRAVLATVNTDNEEELARQQSVAALPTTVLFKNGEALDRFAGSTQDHLAEAIDAAISRA